MLSIVIPVFRNEKNIDRLVQELERIAALAPLPLEVVFVVDGSPDHSLELLQRALPGASFSSVLVSLSRNCGAFNAVRCGLELASGDYFAMLAADLQEPADLALTFLEILRKDEADIAFATRVSRDDPWFDEVSSRVFCAFYRRWVLPEIPPGGVNAVGPGVRPSHTLNPWLVLDGQGRASLAGISPGGVSQTTTGYQVATGAMAGRLTLGELVSRPRWSLSRDGAVLLEPGMPGGVAQALRDAGLEVQENSQHEFYFGSAKVVRRTIDGVIEAAADSRRQAAALAW